jgi:hypothetical protein
MKMKRLMKKTPPRRETLTEAYEVRAFRDEVEELRIGEEAPTPIRHAEPGAFQKIKAAIKGHGEQRVLPDDCQFCDNDLCSVES